MSERKWTQPSFKTTTRDDSIGQTGHRTTGTVRHDSTRRYRPSATDPILTIISRSKIYLDPPSRVPRYVQIVHPTSSGVETLPRLDRLRVPELRTGRTVAETKGLDTCPRPTPRRGRPNLKRPLFTTPFSSNSTRGSWRPGTPRKGEGSSPRTDSTRETGSLRVWSRPDPL